MKRIIALCCALALAGATLAGCAGTAATGSSSTTASGTSSAVGDRTASTASSSTSSASPASSSSATVSSALKDQVDSLMQQAGVTASFAYVDLDTGARYSVNGSEPMVSASCIKLLVLASFLEQVNLGQRAFDEVYTLQASDIVGGTGSLQTQGAGTQVTLQECARLMIAESDNVATNVLINLLGMDRINAEAQTLGLTGTQLNRLMMQSNGTQNYITADDAALILQKIYEGALVSKDMSAFALECLEAQTDGSGFLAGLPAGTVFAHKTGTLGDPAVQNDAGIVEDAHPCILVALTQGNQQAGLNLMSALASAVADNR